MTNKTFSKGLALFFTTFSGIKADDTKTQKIWFMLLNDLTDDQFLFAVTKICRGVKKFYPSDNFAALVREQIAVNIDDEALIAWDAAKKAMAKHGYNRSVKFSDPVIHSVVKIMSSGWSTFCQIPLDKWMQKEFIYNYKIMAKRSEHEEYLPSVMEIENRANGYLNFIDPPSLIETGTGIQRKLGSNKKPDSKRVGRMVHSLAEGKKI